MAKAQAFAFFCFLLAIGGMVVILSAQGVIRLTSGEVPSYGDLSGYFIPLWQHFRVSLLGLELPVWERSQSFGFFYLGNPQCSLFHIPNYLLLLPERYSYSLYIILPYFIAVAGVFALLRKQGVNVGWSLVQAWVVVGNPAAVSLHTMPTAMWTFAWIPWAFYSFKRKSFGFAGFFIGQSFLAGAWDLWAPALLGLTPILFSIGALWKRRFWFGAISLVPAQLIWSFLLLSETSRGVGLGPNESLFWSAGVQHILGFVSPRVEVSPFGAGVWTVFWGARQSWLMATYIGLWSLLFLPILLRKFAHKYSFALFVNMALAVIAFLPSIPVVKSVLVEVGFRSPIRYPDKLLVFPLFMLAFFGLKYVPIMIRWILLRRTRVWIHMGWLFVLLLGSRYLLQVRSETMRLDKGALEVFRKFYFEEVWADMLQVGFFYCVFLALLQVGVRRIRFRVILSLFACLVVSDVCLNGTQWGDFIQVNQSHSTKTTLKNYAFIIPSIRDKRPHVDSGLQPTLHPFWRQVERFPFIAMDSGIAVTNLNNVLAIGRTLSYQEMFGASVRRDSALFWRAGIGTLVTTGYSGLRVLKKFCSDVRSSPDGLTHVCERSSAPLVRVVGTGILINGKDEARKILDTVPVRADAALIETDIPGPVRISRGNDHKGSKVVVERWWNGVFVANVTATDSGWCIFLLPKMKILVALVNGVETPIQNCDLAFSALRIGKGEQRIEIQVNKRYVFIPIGIGLVVLIMIGAAEWWLAKKS